MSFILGNITLGNLVQEIIMQGSQDLSFNAGIRGIKEFLTNILLNFGKQ